MCCTSPHHTILNGSRWGIQPSSCDCGCIGKDRSVADLQHYKDHLETELKSVDRQIKDLQGSDQ